MDQKTWTAISELERKATRLEEQAEEREARAPVYYGGGSSNFMQSMTRAEELRAEARDLRAEAARLRRQDR